MRRVRITFPGAYHHVMNRGYDGNNIFTGNILKSKFFEFLEDSARKMKIRLLAYCIMDTHYHLILENSSGRMSDFLKLLNGNYGMCYRTMEGGKGYVFQGRYKSTLIENDSYLIQSIVYLLRNPVRAGIVQLAENYTWSSARMYFSTQKDIIDADFVNELLGCKEEYLSALHSMVNKEPEVIITKYGEVMGSESFMELAREKHNRRKRPSNQSKGIQREDEFDFEPVAKVLWEFEKINDIKLDSIDIRTAKGKRLRGILLVH